VIADIGLAEHPPYAKKWPRKCAFLEDLGQNVVMHRPVQDADPRAGFLLGRRGLLLGGAAIGATIAASTGTTTAASLREKDVQALNILLLVEHTQAAFYAEALKRGALEGELFQYARQVRAQEEEHLEFLKGVLGERADRKPGFDFGDATRKRDAFVDAAADVEDLAVGAYNGQGSIVSPGVLAEAAKIVSVEARHAAWIRSIVGELPAAEATDKALSADEVVDGLSRLGVRS
jgi:rubrerythrin